MASLSKVYVIASPGDYSSAPPPVDAEVDALVQRMRQASPNWGLRSTEPELNELQLFMLARSKFGLARGLPAGYRVNWAPSFHTVNPNEPWKWLSAPSSVGLRFEVTLPDARANHFLVMFEQLWQPAPAPGTWEEPETITF